MPPKTLNMTKLVEDFSSLGLSEQMLNAVKSKGFEKPSSIQALVIPKLLQGTNDIIAQSQTGTGKTAAFGLPVMQQIYGSERGIKAIVLVPTRELAIQAASELHSFNAEKRLAITAIYGGAAMSEQLRRLSKGVDIVVGTPGRTLDHIRRGTLKLDKIQFLILDEADEMLNMGFIEDVEEIMSHTPDNRRVMLFSATMPQRIVKMSNKYMRNTEIAKVEAQQLTTELTDQIYFEVRESDKFDALTRIIDIQSDFYGIVFCRTKVSVDETVNRLLERGYATDGLHGDVSQGQREKILRKFREKSINILIATDVAARGIDVSNLTHVINYSLPQDSESYVHRIGRTGRAGNQGTAITFITRNEMRQFGFLKRDINAEIKREELPSAQDIIAMKRNKIKEDLREIVVSDTFRDYDDMATELLDNYSPEVALSALLRLAFRSELDERNYPEIRSFSVDRKGTTRLFIALGKRDGYTGRKLVDMLKHKCGLRDKNIDDVKVLESYSFVSVPFADAEAIINKLGARRGRPMAEITKDVDSDDDTAPRRERSSRRRSEGSDFDAPQRSARGTRGAARTERGGRGERSERSERGDRGDRAERKSPARVLRKSELKDSKGSSPRAYKDGTLSGSSQSVKSESSGGFDWSIFESQNDAWGVREPKGKKKR